MKKYIQVAKNTWDETLTYRLNFVMWRLRVLVQIITLYFLWLALIPPGESLFGYDQSMILTYTLGISFISAITLSSRSFEVGEEINNGNLSNFLLRPMNYFLYWFSKDLGDKLVNISFSIVELTILFLILKPPIFLQTDTIILIFSVIATFLGLVLFFFINILLGSLGFWSTEVWAPRFIFMTLLSFFSGGLFPLNILPSGIYEALQLLPFPYLLYFPLSIYLGEQSLVGIAQGIFMCTMWIGISFVLLKFIWNKGLKGYTAQGR